MKTISTAAGGLAYAGGLELALSCDMIIAAAEATFRDAHAHHGLIPGWGGSARLPRRIGAGRAKWMLFTADAIGAAAFMEWGGAELVVPRDALDACVLNVALRMTDKSPLGLRAMKRLVNDGIGLSLTEALALERAAATAQAGSNDRREGLAAFASKRRPEFDGT